MFNIRIKKSPSNKHTGDQDDYSLVRNLAALQSNNTEASVNDKIGAVPRSQATLEAEGGESVFGDVNRDGNMELMHFVGKRHSEGGVPADIPEGSFIFSDTKSLVIKDKEVIEKIFGLPFRKQGYTPAEISKKFDINKYIQILKSETEDEMSKRTAAEMLRSNKDKLGILAFIQESMKGFPDGIPTIAEEVMAKMGVDPQQLMQEAQPQPQEGQAPEQEMSPEEQQMMMAMMQEQGAPMEGDMPMQQYGGLTKMKKGGNNVYQSLELQKSGYNADPLVNNQVQTKVPGVNMDPFIYNANNRNTYDSLRKNPVQGFENSGFEQGKIYTFKSRPGTYYKIGNDGRLHVKNEGTGWKYIPMDDPKGERRKVLEAGFESGLTKEFKKSQPKSTGIPGFDSKAEFEEFKNSGSIEMVVAEEYQKALKSKDPNAMIVLADKLDKQDYETEYSYLGFLPWSNQDKVNDIPKMLREEAAKILNQKQKEKFLANDANNTSTKLTELVKHYETQYQKATDIDQKLKIAKDLKTAKLYLQKVKSPEYKKWIGSVKSSNPVTSPDLFGGSSWKGDFAKDELVDPYSTRFQDVNNVTWTELLDFANKNYSLIKGKPYEKTTFIGDNINNPRDVYEAVPSNKSAVTQSVNPAKNFTMMNGVKYELKPDPALGHYIYTAHGDDGSDLAVTDPTLYAQLNEKFTTQYGKPIKATPPPIEVPQAETADVVVNEKPVVEPTAKEQLRAAPTVQRKPIVQQNTPVQNSTPATKYEGGLNDADFNDLFKQFGGEIDEYEEGGVIDSFGHMMKLPNHVLKKYNPGGPVSKGKKKLANGTEVETFEQTFTDGTVVQIIKDATGNVISQRALAPGSTTIGLNLPAGRNLYRGLTEPLDINNITPEEKEIIKTRWNGNADAYVQQQNTQAALFGDADFTKKMVAQYQKIVQDPTNAFYTGKTAETKKKFADKWGADLKGLNETDIMSELLAQEERNARLNAFGLDVKGSSQAVAGFDKDAKSYKGDKNYWHTNKETLQFIKDHPELADLDFTKGHRGQTGYIAYMKTLQENPEYQQYVATHLGKDDEGVLGLPSTVSGTEGFSTNTTLEERLGFKGKPKQVTTTQTVGEEPKGQWYCVDGKVVQGTIDPASKQEVKPTGTKVEGPFADQAAASAVCNVKTLDTQIPQDEYDGWFMPDIVNYATAMGQRTPFTMPALRQMQAAPSGYDLTNPIQKIAADQSASKQMSDQLFNTMDANTAAAAMMGNKSLENLNAGITLTEEENKKDVNENYQTIGNRAMQVDQLNTQLRGNYDTQVATAIDERARDLNLKDAQIAKLYGTGWWNAARDTGNRVMYPQAKHINRLTGAYDGFGGGRDPLADDTYYSPVSGKNSSSDVSTLAAAEYKRVYEQAIAQNMTPDQAKTLADNASKQVYNDHNYYRDKKHGTNPQQNYSTNVNSYGTQKFGGSIDFGAHAPDYDFGF